MSPEDLELELSRLRAENMTLKRLLTTENYVNESSEGVDHHNADESVAPSTIDAQKDENLIVVVIGASGDLAQKKTYPAMFALFRCFRNHIYHLHLHPRYHHVHSHLHHH